MTERINHRGMQPAPLRPGDTVFVCLIGGAAPVLMTDIVPFDRPRALSCCTPLIGGLLPAAGNDNEARP